MERDTDHPPTPPAQLSAPAEVTEPVRPESKKLGRLWLGLGLTAALTLGLVLGVPPSLAGAAALAGLATGLVLYLLFTTDQSG